jgi:hypothetical protein
MKNLETYIEDSEKFLVLKLGYHKVQHVQLFWNVLWNFEYPNKK